MVRFLGALLLAVLTTAHAWAGIQDTFDAGIPPPSHAAALQPGALHSAAHIKPGPSPVSMIAPEATACCTGKALALTPPSPPCAVDNIILSSCPLLVRRPADNPETIAPSAMDGSPTTRGIFRPPIS